MMKNILLFTLVLCLLSACSGDSSTEPETDAEFETATDFTLNDVDDNPLSLSDFDGQVIVLNFLRPGAGPARTRCRNWITISGKFTRIRASWFWGSTCRKIWAR